MRQILSEFSILFHWTVCLFSLSLKIRHLIHSFFFKVFWLRSLHFHINFRIRNRIKSDYQWPRKMRAGNKRLSGKGEGNEWRGYPLSWSWCLQHDTWALMLCLYGVESWPRNSMLSLVWEDGPASSMCSGPFPSEFPLPSTWLSLKPWSTFQIPELQRGLTWEATQPDSSIVKTGIRRLRADWKQSLELKTRTQVPTLHTRPRRLLKHRNVSPSIQDQ